MAIRAVANAIAENSNSMVLLPVDGKQDATVPARAGQRDERPKSRRTAKWVAYASNETGDYEIYVKETRLCYVIRANSRGAVAH